MVSLLLRLVRSLFPQSPVVAPAEQSVEAAVIHFYYLRNGQRFGPVALPVLRDLWASGQLQPNDLVWHEGAKDWMAAKDLALLRK
jgi:hypothetical protein